MREPYVLSENEIQLLLQGAVTFGLDQTYIRMRDKALASMMHEDHIDEMIADMHDGMLRRARGFECKDSDDERIKNTLYQLASMLRFVSHEVHRRYRKQEKNSGRFLELISNNKSVPARTWRK